MNATSLPALMPALPEGWLAVAAMALLMLGVFRGNAATRLVAGLSVIALGVALVMVLAAPVGPTVTFSGMFIVDEFVRFMKVLVLVGSGLAIVMSLGYIRHQSIERFEYPVLIVLATLGMAMMISANDLIALYIGLELQSLALYVVAAFRRDSTRSSEAGLKYFVLGALASGMLLYGCSLIYGFTGTTSFEALAAAVDGAGQPSTGVIVGLVFVIAGLAFKVSAVPFHMWTPDVYEGAPTPITAFFSVAPKIAAFALFIRVMIGPFAELLDQWQQVIMVIAVASMVLGAFAAIWQSNIKRLMAYSSIGHVGYALVGLAAGSEDGIKGALVYWVIYLAMNVGAFACILCMRREDSMVEQIEDLKGLSRTHPVMALAMAIFMFSLAGIPPLAGFFAKFYVFVAAINEGLYALAVIGLIASVVAAFYYLRIIKVMYFDDPAEPFERPIGTEMTVVMGGAGIFTMFFFVYPAPLLNTAQAAAAALFP